jgi:hypothetical protein
LRETINQGIEWVRRAFGHMAHYSKSGWYCKLHTLPSGPIMLLDGHPPRVSFRSNRS